MSLTSRLVSWLCALPPPETRDVALQRDLPVPMPDGATLLADRYFPRANPKAPTLLVRTPYGRRGFFGALYGRPFAERGFQVVLQSCRGTFGSGGRLEPFFNERADGLATLEWLKAQPWFAGELGTLGASYMGLVQWAIAADAGPMLKAVCATVTASEFRGQTYPGGSFSLDTALSWTRLIHVQEKAPLSLLAALLRGNQALAAGFQHLPLRGADARVLGRTVDFFQEWLAHDAPGDGYWRNADFSGSVADVTAPVNVLGGWYDIFLPWQLRDYAALKAAGREPYLTVGPWAHSSQGVIAASLRESLAWLRAHLLGDRRLLREAPVRVFVMGADTWRDFSTWPPPGTRSQRWHLHPGGALAVAPPPPSEPDHYRYEPARPTPSVGGPLLTADAGPRDNRALEARPDVLSYTSAPLDGELEVMGTVRAELFVRSSLPHTDFFVRLCDVHPSGRSVNLCDALARLSPGQPAPAADGSLAVAFELWPTAHRFRRGHRLRVQVSSGAHPRYARNPGSGEPLATATALVAAEQAVHHDPARPSALLLPVMG